MVVVEIGLMVIKNLVDVGGTAIVHVIAKQVDCQGISRPWLQFGVQS